MAKTTKDDLLKKIVADLAALQQEFNELKQQTVAKKPVRAAV